MKETKKTAKRTKMAAVSMALAAMMAGQTVVVMAGESDSNVLYTFPLTDGIEIEASTMDFNRDKTQYIDQVYEERTNVKIDWNISPVADWSTTLNLRLNSGELPDLMLINKSLTNQFAEEGYFVDFAEYLDQMPNLSAWIEKIPAIYNDTVDGDGHLYCLTTFNTRGQVPRQSIYRKDIWEKEGLEAPTTIDELYDQLVQLKEKYPDSVPVVNRWGASNLIGQLAVLYNTKYDFYLNSDTNTYEYGPATEKFKSAIQTLQKFYEAGLIDPEFATISDDQFVERITSGKALFMFSEYLCCMNTENQGDWNGNGRVNNPDFDLEPLTPLATEYGSGKIEVQSPTARGGYAIAINADSEYVDQLVALVDYQLSDEMIDLVNWGIEGETYDIEDGKKTWMIDNDKKKELGLDARSGMWIPIDQDCSDSSLSEIDIENTMAANAKVSDFAFYDAKKTLSFTAEEQDTISEIMTPVKTYVDEEVMNFITGKKNMEEDWDAFEEKISDMNYEEVLSMYRDKYEKLPEDQKGFDDQLGF